MSYWTLCQTCKHVRSQSGVLANELADYYLAVSARERSRGIPRHYASWFGHTKPKIHSARLLIDQLQRDKSVPISLDGRLRGLYLLLTQHSTGYATSYMREQLEGLSVHIAGFQDCRTPTSEIVDSKFIRIISPAGLGGTELWFSRTLFFLQSVWQMLLAARPDACAPFATWSTLPFQNTWTPQTPLCIRSCSPQITFICHILDLVETFLRGFSRSWETWCYIDFHWCWC